MFFAVVFSRSFQRVVCGVGPVCDGAAPIRECPYTVQTNAPFLSTKEVLNRRNRVVKLKEKGFLEAAEGWKLIGAAQLQSIRFKG